MEIGMLFLSNKQMDELGANDMSLVMHDVRRVLEMHENDELISPGKVVLRWGKTLEDENTLGRINAMPGYVGGEYDMAGIKWIGSNPGNYQLGLPRATVTVILNDPVTKLPVAVADGTAVSAKRTGAVSGLAIDKLAKKDVKAITIVGAGAQSRTQLEAALIVRPDIEKIYISDIMPERAEEFAKEISAKYGKTVIPIENAKEASLESEILITATIAAEPIVDGSWLHKGQLAINLSDYEFTYESVEKCDKIYVDTWDGVKHRKVSTVALMYADGVIGDDAITGELGAVLLGKTPGRENDDELIYFNSVGMGAEDIAVVTRCYKKALELGIGTKVAYWE